MAATARRLYKGTAGTTATTAYTVPASTTTIVKNIVLTNKTASAATATITIVGIEIVNNYSVNANDTVVIDLSLVMQAAETITVQAGTANAINVYISGVEVA
ncbi:hypothetical protein CS060_04185 [Anoxybacillus flavithermus]|uniref:Uncharacterized protein n=1 Tax=Anoxybacillus flavithermus TaxID=33934 RepID=A0A2G5RRZ7_9BACL|nr:MULTISPECIES: hypothetical protein [Anoxybacillus]KFZ41893.1 hypothetical protein JS80_13810 [Anoxybacillus sp. KU2-6(11)]PIC05483.1 hypothetical protein CS060_04185 [Anoxybacillus flavithermus]